VISKKSKVKTKKWSSAFSALACRQAGLKGGELCVVGWDGERIRGPRLQAGSWFQDLVIKTTAPVVAGAIGIIVEEFFF